MSQQKSTNYISFDQDFLDTLKERINIVDLIDSSVPLKRSGKHYEACCPFHDEKTPSFKVTEPEQMFHCFGCGEHGDVYEWFIKHEGLTFFEAVKAAAQFAGVEVPTNKEQSNQERQEASAAFSLGSSLRQILKDGAAELNETPLSNEMMEQLSVGFASNGKLINGMLKKFQERIDVSPLRPDKKTGKPGLVNTDGFSIPLTTKKGAVTGFVFYDSNLKSTPMGLSPQYNPKDQWINIHNISREQRTFVLYDITALSKLDDQERNAQFLLEPSSRTQISDSQFNTAIKASDDVVFVLPSSRYRASAALYALINHSDPSKPLSVMPFSGLSNPNAEPKYLYELVFEYWDNLDAEVKPRIEALLELKGLGAIRDIYVGQDVRGLEDSQSMSR